MKKFNSLGSYNCNLFPLPLLIYTFYFHAMNKLSIFKKWQQVSMEDTFYDDIHINVTLGLGDHKLIERQAD